MKSMVKKIAFIDLDKVVIENTVRFQRARQAQLSYQEKLETEFSGELGRGAHTSIRKGMEHWLEQLYWHTAFLPELLDYDTLVPGADTSIDRIEAQGYALVFLSSRPESLRMATSTWLRKYHILSLSRSLLMKPDPFQYTKTSIWKVGTIHQFASMHRADFVLVIDDDSATLSLLKSYTDVPWTIIAVNSLRAAIWEWPHEAEMDAYGRAGVTSPLPAPTGRAGAVIDTLSGKDTL
jgi:hypothetical protein